MTTAPLKHLLNKPGSGWQGANAAQLNESSKPANPLTEAQLKALDSFCKTHEAVERIVTSKPSPMLPVPPQPRAIVQCIQLREQLERSYDRVQPDVMTLSIRGNFGRLSGAQQVRIARKIVQQKNGSEVAKREFLRRSVVPVLEKRSI